MWANNRLAKAACRIITDFKFPDGHGFAHDDQAIETTIAHKGFLFTCDMKGYYSGPEMWVRARDQAGREVKH